LPHHRLLIVSLSFIIGVFADHPRRRQPNHILNNFATSGVSRVRL
jgi:hypothetical protein